MKQQRRERIKIDSTFSGPRAHSDSVGYTTDQRATQAAPRTAAWGRVVRGKAAAEQEGGEAGQRRVTPDRVAFLSTRAGARCDCS